MNQHCGWLHQALEALPMFAYPYRQECIPSNGIYFQYERGETYGPEETMQRIVRVGSHTGKGNLPKRLGEHFSPSDSWMKFGPDQPKPADRSIYRKHIGRAFLNQANDTYLSVWNIDFTKEINRKEKKHLRDIDKELSLENQITDWLRRTISFRFIIVDDEGERLRLESHCIGTIAFRIRCQPSSMWFGNKSPIKAIKKSGLWNIKHVHGPGIDESDKLIIETSINKTKDWIRIKSDSLQTS